jgi:hypothetical protein
MAIHSQVNQYRGVNAHLHSYYQSHGGWAGFHGSHIADLGRSLNALLPAGYIIDTEQSLQIREFHPVTGERLLKRTQPDMTIFTHLTQPVQTGSAGAAAPTLTQPLLETIPLGEDLYFMALVIYHLEGDETLGHPVTRIELLSPSNKPPNEGYLQYIEKRYAVLKGGIHMVEIDYLHETASPIKGIPAYPQQADSYPYAITVSSPVPSLEAGVSATYGFPVDTPLPTIGIPLLNDTSISLNFDAVYQQTFSSMKAYSLRVDYEALPERFDSYGAADQERIRRRMAAVQEAYRNRLNLEEGPFPVDEVERGWSGSQ